MAIIAGIFGLLVGSFSNVLIWRLPRGENIAFPPSHCPKCDHPLGVLDLVPVFSWLALGGKCRYCRAPINPRYPIVELLTGAGYFLIAYLYPLSTFGAGSVGLMILFTLLLVGSAIDLDTFTIPNPITMTGVLLGLAFALVNERTGASEAGLPTFAQAVNGALMGAGALVTIDLFGSWVLRRFRERQYPDFPIGYQQISLGLLVGAWAGPWWALGAAILSTLVNVIAKKVVPIPEILTLGGALISIMVGSSGYGPGLIVMVQHMLAGAGAAALVAAFYWWALELMGKFDADEDDDAPADPGAMGFGDVKLAAAIGAFLGWENLLVAIFVAVFAGALIGVVQMMMSGQNRMKFGPPLAIGAVTAMLWGEQIVGWYKGLIGL